MAEYLFLRFTEQPAEAMWIALDGDGRVSSPIAQGPIAAARAAAEHCRVVLLVPGPDVITTQVVLPAASQARLRKMLPYSLEEALAEDVEHLLFAVGPRLPSGAVAVSVVAKQQMELWLEALRSAGITPHAVYSDAEGVPDTPSTLTLMVQGERIYGRRPEQPPFVLEGLGIAEVLDLLRSGSQQTDQTADLRHLLVYVDRSGQALYQSELARLQHEIASCDVKLMADGMLPRSASTLVHRPGTNLLQGHYAPKSNWSALLRPWRVAAGLAIGVVLLALLAEVAGYLALRREDQQLIQLVTAGCERLVASERLSDCESEVSRRLAGAGPTLGSGESFLSTLAAIAGSHDPQSRIEALTYRNRIMDLQLVAPNVPALDEFVRQLGQTARFEPRIESTNETESGVEGRIQVVSVDQ